MDKILGLNTLRFLSFLGIFIFHSTSIFEYGYLGVNFFFVLSSFLLTYLAFEEKDTSNSFSQFNFFVRRALRIFPLYYFIIIFSFFVLPIVSANFGEVPSLPQNKLLYWFLLSNYETTDCIFSLKFLWSIAVEEQFYLLFILLSFLLFRNVRLLTLLLMLCYFIFMFISYKYDIPTYSNTLTYLPCFSAGIFGGYLFYKKTNFNFLPEFLFAFSLGCAFLLKYDIVFDISISILFLSVILIANKYSNYLKNLLVFKATEKLGTYTYGLYVYSGFVITLVSNHLLIENVILKFVTELTLVIIIAILSYHLFEKHFLKLKKYFR